MFDPGAGSYRLCPTESFCADAALSGRGTSIGTRIVAIHRHRDPEPWPFAAAPLIDHRSGPCVDRCSSWRRWDTHPPTPYSCALCSIRSEPLPLSGTHPLPISGTHPLPIIGTHSVALTHPLPLIGTHLVPLRGTHSVPCDDERMCRWVNMPRSQRAEE